MEQQQEQQQQKKKQKQIQQQQQQGVHTQGTRHEAHGGGDRATSFKHGTKTSVATKRKEKTGRKTREVAPKKQISCWEEGRLGFKRLLNQSDERMRTWTSTVGIGKKVEARPLFGWKGIVHQYLIAQVEASHGAPSIQMRPKATPKMVEKTSSFSKQGGHHHPSSSASGTASSPPPPSRKRKAAAASSSSAGTFTTYLPSFLHYLPSLLSYKVLRPRGRSSWP